MRIQNDSLFSQNPQSFDYSHQGNFPPAFDYNHGGDQFNFQVGIHRYLHVVFCQNSLKCNVNVKLMCQIHAMSYGL